MDKQTKNKAIFADLGLSKTLLVQLNKLGFTHPTPIQEQSIPVSLKGQDVIGIAQTGTGKTLAFSIPMLQSIADGKSKGLVILPTRELASQVEEEISKIGRFFGVKTAVLIGGASAHHQIKQLRRNPNVIIATPGRLIDFLDQGVVSLENVKVLVLDEADRMLDMGFEPQIQKVLEQVPEKRQTLLFSATMPEAITKIVKQYMKDPVRIEVSRAGESAKKIEQEAYLVQKNDKLNVLMGMLPQTTGPVLVFTRTKHGAKKLNKQLREFGYRAAEIHSNRSQSQRRVALEGFKSGKFRVLVATDIAARGIDVNNIELVVNFDLPDQIEDYVHRIGRTGRAGKSGTAASFVMPREQRDLRRIEKLIGKRIKLNRLKNVPELPEKNPVRDEQEFRPQRRGGNRRFGRQGGKHKPRARRSGYGKRQSSGGRQTESAGQSAGRQGRRRSRRA